MNEQDRFTAGSSVYVALTDNGAVLLDTRRGSFQGLNTSATMLWKLLIDQGKSIKETQTAFAAHYHLPDEDVQADLQSFLTSMIDTQLIMAIGSPEPLNDSRTSIPWLADLVFPHWLIWVEATLTFRVLHRLLVLRNGLAILARHFRTLPGDTPVTATHEAVVQLQGALASTALWQPFKVACLHHSLALNWMLRKRRMQADVVIGVYKTPFSAHAWVESAGEIIQWEAGLAYPDETFLHALSIIFHTNEVHR